MLRPGATLFPLACPERAEGSNIPLKLHRLRQDIYEHLAGLHGFGAEPFKLGEEQELRLDFEQFWRSLWPQVRDQGNGMSGGALHAASHRFLPPCAPSQRAPGAPGACPALLCLVWPLLQFTVWEAHQAGAHNEELERENARRKFVLLDTNADNYLTAEARAAGEGGACLQGGATHGQRAPEFMGLRPLALR